MMLKCVEKEELSGAPYTGPKLARPRVPLSAFLRQGKGRKAKTAGTSERRSTLLWLFKHVLWVMEGLETSVVQSREQSGGCYDVKVF
jgi:hypothetical protein